MLTALEFATVETGYSWDALRLREPWGSDVYKALAAHPADLEHLGHVILSAASHCTYWPIPLGTTADDWPLGCRLLSRNDWVTLPGFGVPESFVKWLHRPGIGDLQTTGAVWLAAALDTTRRAA